MHTPPTLKRNHVEIIINGMVCLFQKHVYVVRKMSTAATKSLSGKVNFKTNWKMLNPWKK